MNFAADILRDIGFVLYAGPMVMWAFLMHASGTLHHQPQRRIVRVFRCWGPGFGLAMGATVLGALSSRWLQEGGFQWSAGTLDAYAWLTFLMLWISNIKLEIWTLDPLRKLDDGNQIADEAAYSRACSALTRHLSVQTVLIFTLAALAIRVGASTPT